MSSTVGTRQWLAARNRNSNPANNSCLVLGKTKEEKEIVLIDGKPEEIPVQDLLQLLLKKTTTAYGNTAALLAARNGRADTLEILLDNGADMGAKNQNDDTLLSSAISSKNLETVQLMIDREADLKAKNGKGDPVLKLAVQHGFSSGTNQHIPIMEELIAGGADIYARDSNGDTALTYAVQNCVSREKLISVLIAAGGKDYVNEKNKEGESALIIFIKKYMKFGDEIMYALINAGADMHATDNKGRSFLKFVAWRGTAKMLQQLSKEGLDFLATYENDETLLMYAAQKRNDEIVNFLIEESKGQIYIDKVDHEGNTALLHALSSGRGSAARLIEAGADISIRNDQGDGAVSLAAASGDIVALRMLINGMSIEEREEELNGTNRKGNSPLMLAARGGHVECVRELLKGGAKSLYQNPKNEKEKNAAGFATEKLAEAQRRVGQNGNDMKALADRDKYKQILYLLIKASAEEVRRK